MKKSLSRVRCLLFLLLVLNLHFFFLNPHEDGATTVGWAVGQARRIRALSLRRTALDWDAAVRLAGQLTTCKKLQELDLSFNNLGNVGVRACASLLARRSALQLLDLRGAGVQDEGVSHLAEALTANNKLATLLLGNNGITGEGASALAAALLTNRTLVMVDLSNNPIGSDGAVAMAARLTGSSIDKRGRRSGVGHPADDEIRDESGGSPLTVLRSGEKALPHTDLYGAGTRSPALEVTGIREENTTSSFTVPVVHWGSNTTICNHDRDVKPSAGEDALHKVTPHGGSGDLDSFEKQKSTDGIAFMHTDTADQPLPHLPRTRWARESEGNITQVQIPPAHMVQRSMDTADRDPVSSFTRRLSPLSSDSASSSASSITPAFTIAQEGCTTRSWVASCRSSRSKTIHATERRIGLSQCDIDDDGCAEILHILAGSDKEPRAGNTHFIVNLSGNTLGSETWAAISSLVAPFPLPSLAASSSSQGEIAKETDSKTSSSNVSVYVDDPRLHESVIGVGSGAQTSWWPGAGKYRLLDLNLL